MNILHVNFVPSDLFGVKKKISSQVDSLKKLGHHVELCTYEESGYLIIDKTIKYGSLARFKRKLFEYRVFKNIELAMDEKSYDVIYVRFMRMTPWYYSFLENLSKHCNSLVIEVATYPYDSEYSKYSILTLFDIYYRNRLRKFVDTITFYGEPCSKIWGIPAIQLKNAVDVESTEKLVKTQYRDNRVTFIAVANLSRWHAYDRFIRSIYEQKEEIGNKVRLLIVGDGPEKNKLMSLVSKLKLDHIVKFKGPLSGDALSNLFNESDIGLCSLGLHRIGHETLTPLKPAEYCARGLPFILANQDSRFSDQPFIFRVASSEDYIDIVAILEWFDKRQFDIDSIRDYAKNNLTWDNQMKILTSKLENQLGPEKC